MAAALKAEDPDGIVVPYCLSAGTDAKWFSRLGIRCFGFSPLQLPPQLDFAGMFHGIDERVPVDGLTFGVRVLDRLLDDGVASKRPNGAYDATAEGSLPAAVGKQPEPGKFPCAVLRVVREDAPRGVARRAAWQVQDEVVILGHYLLLCARRGTVQVESENFRWLLRGADRA